MKNIRWLIRVDLPRVCEIDYFVNAPYWWTETDVRDVLRARNAIGMVLEVDGYVAGFMIYELHKNNLNVRRFAIDPEHQRKGFGSALIQRLKDKLSQQRRTTLFFTVDESNLAAQLFMRSNGFRAISVSEGENESEILFRYCIHENTPVA